MGFWADLDRVVFNGLLPGGVQPFSGDTAGVETGQTATAAALAGQPVAGAAGLKGPTACMVGKVTASGFVPTRMVKGSPIMTTAELSLLKRARRVGRDLGHALGLHSRFAKAVKHGR